MDYLLNCPDLPELDLFALRVPGTRDINYNPEGFWQLMADDNEDRWYFWKKCPRNFLDQIMGFVLDPNKLIKYEQEVQCKMDRKVMLRVAEYRPEGSTRKFLNPKRISLLNSLTMSSPNDIRMIGVRRR